MTLQQAKKQKLPTQIKTEADAKAYHGQRPPRELRALIKEMLPDTMHVDSENVVRYKNGENPNSLKQLKPENGHKFKENNRAAANKISYQPIKQAYKKGLEKKTTCPVTGEEITFAEALQNMHCEAIVRCYQKKNWSLFDRLSTDFRLNAGEIPTQETVNTNKNIDLQEFDNLTDQQKAALAKEYLTVMAENSKKQASNTIGKDKKVS